MDAADGVVGVQRGREGQRRVAGVLDLQPLLQAVGAHSDLQHAHAPAEQKENVLRSRGVCMSATRKGHCRRGPAWKAALAVPAVSKTSSILDNVMNSHGAVPNVTPKIQPKNSCQGRARGARRDFQAERVREQLQLLCVRAQRQRDRARAAGRHLEG